MKRPLSSLCTHPAKVIAAGDDTGTLPLSFVLWICPQSCQFGGKRLSLRGGRAHFFSDDRTRAYHAAIRILARRYRPPSPFPGPLGVDLLFVLPRPERLSRRQDPAGLIPCDRRPDRDNLAKGTLDALTRAGFWQDDGQIVEGDIAKAYAEIGQAPRIEVILRPATLAAWIGHRSPESPAFKRQPAPVPSGSKSCAVGRKRRPTR